MKLRKPTGGRAISLNIRHILPLRKTTGRAGCPARPQQKQSASRSARRAGRPVAGTGARTAAGRTGPQQRLRLAGKQTLALGLLTGELTGAADRFRLLPRLLFGGLFVVSAELHLAENALALHLFLQRLEGLVDIVVTDENLHACSFCQLGSLRLHGDVSVSAHATLTRRLAE